MDLIILYRITADLKVETDIITSIADSPITKLSKNTTQHAPDTTTRKQAQTTQIRRAPSHKQLDRKDEPSIAFMSKL